jgi:hypothetical protein
VRIVQEMERVRHDCACASTDRAPGLNTRTTLERVEVSKCLLEKRGKLRRSKSKQAEKRHESETSAQRVRRQRSNSLRDQREKELRGLHT